MIRSELKREQFTKEKRDTLFKLIDKKTLNGPLAANFKKRLTELFDEREYEKKREPTTGLSDWILGVILLAATIFLYFQNRGGKLGDYAQTVGFLTALTVCVFLLFTYVHLFPRKFSLAPFVFSIGLGVFYYWLAMYVCLKHPLLFLIAGVLAGAGLIVLGLIYKPRTMEARKEKHEAALELIDRKMNDAITSYQETIKGMLLSVVERYGGDSYEVDLALREYWNVISRIESYEYSYYYYGTSPDTPDRFNKEIFVLFNSSADN